MYLNNNSYETVYVMYIIINVLYTKYSIYHHINMLIHVLYYNIYKNTYVNTYIFSSFELLIPFIYILAFYINI